MSAWTRKAIGRIWQEVMDDVEASSAYTMSILWKSTLRRVVGEKEGRGAITFTNVREHFKLFPVENFLWWVRTNRGEKKTEDT